MRQPVPSPIRLIPLILALFAALPAEAGVNVWTPVGPEGGFVFSLAVDPASRAIYAGTQGGVFVSTNGGGSWERRSRGLRGGVAFLAAASVPSPAVYASGGPELYRSTDGGASWVAVLQSVAGLQISALAVHPANSAIVYVGTLRNGVWKSSDRGATWKQVFEDASCGAIHSLVIPPQTPATIYAGCEDDSRAPFFRSRNGGVTWTAQGSPLPEEGHSFHLALDPGRPNVIYLTAAVSVGEFSDWVTFKSTNGGSAWTRLSVRGSLLEVSPAGTLFIGKHRSRDGGRSWEELPVIVTPYVKAFDPADPSIVYASFFSTGDFMSSGIYKSTDAGTTWSPASRGLFATTIEDLAIDPRSTLYALVFGTGLLKGPDGGARWRRADAGLPVHALFAGNEMPALAIDPVEPANLYLGWRNGFARSADGGDSWMMTLQEEQCVGINALVVDPADPERLYASGSLGAGSCGPAGSTCPVFRSGDAGATWECAAPRVASVERIVMDPTEPARIYALSHLKGVWVSNNRGETWSRLKTPSRIKSFSDLAVDPGDARRLYLATLEGRVYKSTDRGATWTDAFRGLPNNGPIRRVAIDPSRPQTVYAAGLAGVYISGNGGRTWFPLNGGLTDVAWTFLLDPQNPRKLYTGTYNNGVYVHERR